jgi:transporter family-2 protein
MNILVAAAMSAAIGAGVAVQIAMNGQNRMILGHPFHAAFLNIAGAFTICLAIITVMAIAWPSVTQYRAIPAQNWLTGVFGVSYLVVAAFLVPIFGTAKVFIFALLGQLVATAAIDHFGWLGTPQQPLDLKRAAGLALVFGGALLVTDK